MRTIRCFTEQALLQGQRLSLPEEVSNHLLRVLRLGPGARIVLFNGDGCDYPATLLSAGKRQCEAELGAAQPVENESPLRIHLLQGIARGEKMDLILQKATELGVHALYPVLTERTEVRLDGERAAKRHGHWRGVIRSACEQCGRARLPQLAAALDLPQALAAVGEIKGYVLEPSAGLQLQQLPAATGDIALLIGPEGGLGERDLLAATQAGWQSLRLGPRILRCETAGLAAISALQARWGDLG